MQMTIKHGFDNKDDAKLWIENNVGGLIEVLASCIEQMLYTEEALNWWNATYWSDEWEHWERCGSPAFFDRAHPGCSDDVRDSIRRLRLLSEGSSREDAFVSVFRKRK